MRHFRPFLSRHQLWRARLSAVRRAARSYRLRPGPAPPTTSLPCSTISASSAPHVCGLSMGGFATLHFRLPPSWPGPARSASPDAATAQSRRSGMFFPGRGPTTSSAALRRDGMAAFAERYGPWPPPRVQFEAKGSAGALPSSRRNWRNIPPLGAANTQLGCQKERPSLYALTSEMAALDVPTLILTGDEDWPCLAPGLLMKRTIPSAGALGDAELRPHHQSRGSRPLQCHRRRLPSRWSMRGAGRPGIPARSGASITGMRT